MPHRKSLDQGKAKAPPPANGNAWAAIIRGAAKSCVSPDDVGQMFESVKQKAMEGNTKAMDFLFGYLQLDDDQVGCENSNCGMQSILDQRRKIARYMTKNGATSKAHLCELFELSEERVEKVCSHIWFAPTADGWHITSVGRRENE
jgi:hypothetical protein